MLARHCFSALQESKNYKTDSIEPSRRGLSMAQIPDSSIFNRRIGCRSLCREKWTGYAGAVQSDIATAMRR